MSDLVRESLLDMPLGGLPVIYPQQGADSDSDPPPPVSDDPSGQSLMAAYESAFLQLYSLPRMHPDAFVLHRGYDLADEMLSLGAYSTPLRILLYAILFQGWQLLPALESKEQEKKDGFESGDYDLAQRMLESTQHHLSNIRNPLTDKGQDFTEILKQMLWGMHHGFSVQTLQWGEAKYGTFAGQWTLEGATYRRCKQIGFDLDRNTLGINAVRSWPLGLTRAQKKQGQRYPVEQCVIFTFDKENGLPYGRGLFRACYKHYYTTDKAMRDEVIAARRAGGWMEAITDDPVQQANALTVLQAVENGAGLAHGSLVQYIEHQGMSGSLNFLANLRDFHVQQQTEIILGQLLTTKTGGKSSYALGVVQEGTQDYMRSNPMHLLEYEGRDQIIRRLCAYNYGREKAHLAPYLFMGDVGLARKGALAKLVETYTRLGYLHPSYDAGWVRKEAGYKPFDVSQKNDIPLPELPDRERINITEGDGPDTEDA